MKRPRITITLNKKLLEETDKLIDGKKIRNRSHAIEFIIGQHFQTNINTAVILAGGQGTKLRPYTYEMPKSLLPIKGKPLLEHMINNLKRNNIKDVVICTGYLGEKIKEYFGNGEKFGVTITYSQEASPSLTGGALLKVKKYLKNQPFLLIYGDLLTNIPLMDLINFHKEQKSIATIALTTVDSPSDFGQLKLHGTKLVNFFQKTKETEIKSHLVNCGIYVLETEIFSYLPVNKQSFLLEDTIEKLIKNKKVSGFVFEGQWFDVGTLKNYEKAIKEFEIPKS